MEGGAVVKRITSGDWAFAPRSRSVNERSETLARGNHPFSARYFKELFS
ncbi:MAG: hypothetical protein QF393_16950 [Rhodospirillales bacterium]|jgi:hypothetical protein|nr:hypothetical protein [Rhodospirillales bacterium]MDP6646364.1 hypothetical protein [Rhodospirillales bacterium]|tara:strand:+ start:1144 stop:1290 length:147 start_codon:yes stop_codon:yes gene_type:complete